MNIQHEILSFNPETGSILVKYFCSEIPEGLIYNIDLPIENNQYPNENSIVEIIKQFEPNSQLGRMINLKNISIPMFLLELIPPMPEPLPPIDEAQPIISGTDPLPI